MAAPSYGGPSLWLLHALTLKQVAHTYLEETRAPVENADKTWTAAHSAHADHDCCCSSTTGRNVFTYTAWPLKNHKLTSFHNTGQILAHSASAITVLVKSVIIIMGRNKAKPAINKWCSLIGLNGWATLLRFSDDSGINTEVTKLFTRTNLLRRQVKQHSGLVKVRLFRFLCGRLYDTIHCGLLFSCFCARQHIC